MPCRVFGCDLRRYYDLLATASGRGGRVAAATAATTHHTAAISTPLCGLSRHANLPRLLAPLPIWMHSCRRHTTLPTKHMAHRPVGPNKRLPGRKRLRDACEPPRAPVRRRSCSGDAAVHRCAATGHSIAATATRTRDHLRLY